VAIVGYRQGAFDGKLVVRMLGVGPQNSPGSLAPPVAWTVFSEAAAARVELNRASGMALHYDDGKSEAGMPFLDTSADSGNETVQGQSQIRCERNDRYWEPALVDEREMPRISGLTGPANRSIRP